MKAEELTETLDLALEALCCDKTTVLDKPRLQSDSGASYVYDELAEWLENQKMDHARGAPYQPQAQRNSVRWHETLKNRILLVNSYVPSDLRGHIDTFFYHYNHRRYRASVLNTHADVCFGRGQPILKQIERANRQKSTLRDACLTTHLPHTLTHLPDSIAELLL